MSTQKIHIGPNGPAPCRATVRPCEYEISGTKEDVTRIWEKQQEALFADTMLSGVSKAAINVKPEPETPTGLKEHDRGNPSKIKATSVLSSRDKYVPAVETVEYRDSDKDIAMKLALSNLTELSYTPVQSEDNDWQTNGCSDVERYILEDGSVGYFKSFSKNSELEDSFESYETTSLGAAINEVNAYRMAQAFGGKYAEMVPETVIREINGSLGTLQREVTESESSVNYEKDPALIEDARRAAIFDFVIGNQDRHERNFLYSDSDEGHCIKLIDNSFSFPPKRATLNASMFTDNESGHYLEGDEAKLTKEDVDALDNARTTVQEWINSKTIDPALGEGTINRIDFIRRENQLTSYYHWRFNCKETL